ncbi:MULTISPECIES: DUF4330 domain-containing protein [Cyanophyceae]|jgi:hypothetical protein|uniref:DUF4330 domain-containing protein n=1 Tax=Cyanophyceae TaxID=3028117 RepID=UPI0016882157|nr:DUF4330 domain-containing protein [Trichocoleus sp. FACHB-69]MBD1931860.1 DUF4330 domain-containing protein [Trichocoleus sp. FACHB-69]
MKILDSQGRLFGKVSILDVAAALVILSVIVGIFFFPGTSGSVAQVGVTTKPVEVDAIVRGLNVLDPQGLMEQFEKDKKVNIIIRNQPAGQMEIKSVKLLPRTVVVPQPDGSVKALADPRQDSFSTDMLMNFATKGQTTKDGLVIGGTKVKIGMPLELDGSDYNFNVTVIDIRLKG